MPVDPETSRAASARFVLRRTNLKNSDHEEIRVEELLRTNDMVLISFVEALLSDARIEHLVLDQNMSVMEGSIGVLPRRVLVDQDRIEDARRLLSDAGIAQELSDTRR
jgi:hypothetical protein